MRWLTPEDRGVVYATLVMVGAGLTGAILGIFWDPSPSPEFLRTMSGIGASFFLAYIIEATWIVRGIKSDETGQVSLGVFTGLALNGLAGVVAALILSESGSTGSSAQFFLWWSGSSLVALGFIVAIQPMLVHDRQHRKND